MECIYCGHKTKVVNSRKQQKSNSVWRRRHCPHCLASFTTVEQIDLARSILIRHKDVLKPFDYDKLYLSIYNSCKHRSTAISDAKGLSNTISNKVMSLRKPEISRKTLGELCLEVLKHFDKVAAIHYQAYYCQD